MPVVILNAKTMPTPENNSFLIVGPPGAGKTSQWRTLPDGTAFVFATDPNFGHAVKGSGVHFVEIKADELDIDVHPVRSDLKKKFRPAINKVKEPKAYIEFERIYDELWATKRLDQYRILGFDSISTLLNMIMDRVQFMNGRLGQVPERQDYNMQMHAFHNLMRDVIYRKKIFVGIGHEKQVKQGENAPMTWELAMTGDLRLKIPILFSNIWRMEADRGIHTIITQSSSKHRYIRSAIEGLPLEVNTTFNAEKRYLQQYGLGRILVEAGIIPGPEFKTKLLQPGTVATAKPKQQIRRK